MSCGQPHETHCSDVLAEVWMFLDHECDEGRRATLLRHLDECNPCLERYGIEDKLKELLARKCGGEHAPDSLKQRLRDCIRETVLEQVEVTIEHTPTGTTVEVRHRVADLDGGSCESSRPAQTQNSPGDMVG